MLTLRRWHLPAFLVVSFIIWSFMPTEAPMADDLPVPSIPDTHEIDFMPKQITVESTGDGRELALEDSDEMKPLIGELPQKAEEDETEPIESETKPKVQGEWPSATLQHGQGKVKPVGQPYTKTIVVPKTKGEEVDWIAEHFGGDEHIDYAVYVVDDPTAPFHPPKNKGHEVMVYLSYIIDHYYNLSDVNIFMHAHQHAWHNDDLLGQDAVEMISRLSAEHVTREGYMNMRCHWGPGCPAWMHPGTVEEDINKQEETVLAQSWSELFPLDPIPNVLAQPCCAQFAISKERIRSMPITRYTFYRDWLLRTTLSDYISGRVWEYVWQFLFTGNHVVCPKEHICYCDGFGVCFGGEEEYDAFYKRYTEREKLEEQLRKWHELDQKFHEHPEEFGAELEPPEPGKDMELEGRIKGIQAWCEHTLQKAKEHGDVAMNRAKEAGREWHDGGGF